MLLALRHDAIVGGHGKKDQIDSMSTGEHVANEPLVTGNVDHPRPGAVGQCEKGEPEIDGNSALLLFLETIGLLAGECANQGRLAMVDMTGGANDRVGHGRWHQVELIAAERIWKNGRGLHRATASPALDGDSRTDARRVSLCPRQRRVLSG